MAGGELALFHQLPYGGGQAQQAQGIGDGAAGFAHLLGGFLLGHVIGLDQGLETGGFLHGIQVLPLEVFDHGQLGGLPVVGFDDDHRHLLEPRDPGGPPAALTGNDLVIAGGKLAHRQRLDDTVFTDGVRQFCQRGLVKGLPGLGGTALHL